MKDLEAAIGYSFSDPALLTEALTHSSYAHEQHKNMKCNERLEFLGDAVLSIVVSDYIYKHCPNLPEGELTKLRASLVCEKSLFDFAKVIDLGSYLRLSNGERRNGGASSPSIVADAFEALIAAIYLDGGMEPAREHILPPQQFLQGLQDCPPGDNPEEPWRASGIHPRRLHRPRPQQAFQGRGLPEQQRHRTRRRPLKERSGAAGRP